MKTKSKIVAGVAASSIALASFSAAPAYAEGTVSLASVLNISNQAYDSNWADFDILTAAINAVLAAKPASAVGVLADGTEELTAFIPTDRAFRKLVRSLGGGTLNKEANVFAAVADLGIDAVEQVLLYHVVLGAPVTRAQIVELPNFTQLTTAEGSKITLYAATSLVLRDLSALPNPRVIINRADVNKGNNQIAHPINRVLLPDLD